jgi:hypothetical protein
MEEKIASPPELMAVELTLTSCHLSRSLILLFMWAASGGIGGIQNLNWNLVTGWWVGKNADHATEDCHCRLRL